MDPISSFADDSSQANLIAPEQLETAGSAAPAAAAPEAAGPGKPAPTAPPPPPPTQLNFFKHHVLGAFSGESADRQLAGMQMAASSTGLPPKMPSKKEAEKDYRDFVVGQGLKFEGDEVARFNKLYNDATSQYRDYQEGNYNSANLESAFDNTSVTAAAGLYTDINPNNKRRKLQSLNGGAIDLAAGGSLGDPRPLSEIIRQAAENNQNVGGQEYIQRKAWEQIVSGEFDRTGEAADYDNKTKQGQRDQDGRLISKKQENSNWFNSGVIADVDDYGNVRPVLLRNTDDVYSAPTVLSKWGYDPSSNGVWRFVSRLGSGIAGGLLTGAATIDNLYESAISDKAGRLPWELNYGIETQADKLLGKDSRQQYDSRDSQLAKSLLLLGSQVKRGRAVDERGSIFASSGAFWAGSADVASQVVPQLGMALLTDGGSIAALSYSAIDGYGSTYKQFSEMGYSSNESKVAGVIAGAITAGSEKLLEGNWIARLVKGNPGARELIEKPLVEMVQHATNEALQELESQGVKVTEQTLMGQMSTKVPNLYNKFTNTMSALNAKLGKASSQLGKGDNPIDWKDMLRGMRQEGLQEVVEGVGQEAQQVAFDNFVFNGRIYGWDDVKPGDRLDVDTQAWKQRRDNWNLGEKLLEQAESFTLGAVGGGVGEAPFIVSAKRREARRRQEEGDLQNALLTHYVENGGRGMDALKQRAVALGRENRWGTQLTTGGELPGDNQVSENDLITRNVLNQIELMQRVAHESKIFDRMKKDGLTVQQAVGTLSTMLNENDLYKRGLSDLLRVQNARQVRDNALSQVQASPDGQSSVAAAAGQPGAATAVLNMTPAQVQQERDRRLAEARQIQDADEQAKKVDYLNQRYQTAQDTGALGVIARFDGVYDYYEAARRVAETTHKLEQSDASDVAGVQNLRNQLDVYQQQQEQALTTLVPQLAGNSELARVKEVADHQLAYDNLQQRANSVFDGTMVQQLTQESFLREHYMGLLNLAADKTRFDKLPAEQRRFVLGQIEALNDPTQGFFNEKASLKVDGDTLRRLSWDRKNNVASTLALAGQQQQQAEAAQLALNQVPNTLLAALPTVENEADLVTLSGQALSLAQALGKGQLGFDAAEGQRVSELLRERAKARLAPLREAVTQDPANSLEAYKARGVADGTVDEDTPLELLEDDHADYLAEKLGQVQDAAADAATEAADTLSSRLQNLTAYQPGPLPTAEQLQVLLGTSSNAAATNNYDATGSDLDHQLADFRKLLSDDPDKLASIDAGKFDQMRGSIMRNLALAEINDKVNNLLYERQVAGKGVAVDASVDGALKTQAREQAEAEAEAARVEAGAPAPEPDSATTALGKAGKKAAQKLDDKSVAAEVAPAPTRRERLTKMLEGIMAHKTQGASEQLDQLRADAIKGGWFERSYYTARLVGTQVQAQALEEFNDWYQNASDEEADRDYTATRDRIFAQARQRVHQQLLAEARKAPAGGVALLLGKVANFVLNDQLDADGNAIWQPEAQQVAIAAGISDRYQQAKNWLQAAFGKMRTLLERQVRAEAIAIWHWSAPFGNTAGLHYQSKSVYESIYAQSRKQLGVLDELLAARAAALSNRSVKDLQRRVGTLQQHVAKLLNAVILPTSVLTADEDQQKLAQAQGLLNGLKSPQTLEEVGNYQVVVHQAEELLRQAFNTPAKQQALAGELLEEAQKVLVATGLQVTPADLAVMGWRQMLSPGPGLTEGSAFTLFALFGASRAEVAAHYDQWLSDAFPALGDGKQPTPSLEQVDRVREAVQVLTAPWLFAPDHQLSQQALSDDSLFGVVRNAVFLTGFAGTGKTQMAGSPVISILASLSGQRPGGAKFSVVTTAQFETQRADIAASVGRAATRVDVQNVALDDVLGQLNDGTFSAPALAIDETTILTRNQSQALVSGIQKTNERRMEQGQPPVHVLMLGDEAQLSGKTTDPATGATYRMNKNHPIVQSLVLPRLQPLEEIYRTGYVVLDAAQTELRRRVLSFDNDVRRDNSPIEGQYTLPIAGDYTSLAGLQYQGQDEQRQQIATHIKQLVAAGNKQVLRVVVSDNEGKGVAAEVAALGSLGVAHPEQYVVAVDQAQGKTYDFTYVAVNETNSQQQFSGNDNLRATLVGVSRSKVYASVRTRLTSKINNRLETDLTRFTDNEAAGRQQERGLESQARRKENAQLAALAPAGVVATTTQPAAATQQPGPVATASGPAATAAPTQVVDAEDEQQDTTAAEPGSVGQQMQELRRNVAQAEQLLTEARAALDQADPTMELGALQQTIIDTENAYQESVALLDEMEAAQREQTEELQARREQISQDLSAVVARFPSAAPTIVAGTSLEGELDHQDAIAREAQLDESRVALLRQGQAHLADLVEIHNGFVQAGDQAAASELATQIQDTMRKLGIEAHQQLEAQRSLLAVGSEDDMSQWPEAETRPVTNISDVDATTEQAPGIVVGQRVVGNELLPGTIIAQVPFYDSQGNFLRMDTRQWDPKPGSTLEQLVAARTFINQQIGAIRASRVQFEKNRTATLFKQNKVVLHAALAPSLGLDEARWNKASFLRKLLAEAGTTTNRSAQVSRRWFENYRLSGGVKLAGEGKFFLVYHESYRHGADLPSNDQGEFDHNIFEVVYREQVGGATYEVGLGMVRRELGTPQGRVRRNYEAEGKNALDDLFVKAQRAGSLSLGEVLPLQDVRPPAYLARPEDADGDARDVAEFRELMRQQNVGVSRPYVITVASHDDFVQGNYSFYYGDVDEYNQQGVAGGRKMLSGRAAVFTAYGVSEAELSDEINRLVATGQGDAGRSAREIIGELRTKYDAEMVLLDNANLGLSDYAAVVLGEPGGQVTTAADLLRRRRTVYDPTAVGASSRGIAVRTVGTDQKGFASDPVAFGVEVARTFFTTNQARFYNTPAELAESSRTLDRGGIINKFYNLLTSPEAGIFRDPGVGNGPVALSEKGLSLLADGVDEAQAQELREHAERIVTLLRDVDVQRDSTRDFDPETGILRNPFWASHYAPDLVLYLSYFNNKLGGQLSEAWEGDEDNQVQINPSFGTGMRTNTFTPVANISSTRATAGDGGVLNLENMLSTRRTIKTAPSFVLDLQEVAQGYASAAAPAPEPAAAPPTPEPASAQQLPAAAPASSQPVAAAPVAVASDPEALVSADMPAPARRPRRGGPPPRASDLDRNRLNEDGTQDGDLDPQVGARILERIFGSQPSTWLQGVLDRTPWLRKVVQPLGLGLDRYWQFDGDYPFSVAYGAMVGGLMQLNRGNNGLLQSLTPRHEALHYALQLLSAPRRDQVLAWGRVAWEGQGNANAGFASELEVEEWLADHYSRLFEHGDERAIRTAERWSWLPAPLVRLFFNLRDAFHRIDENDELALLDRYLRDLESGRYRGQRVSRESQLGEPAKLARNEAGLRERAFEATAALFGGRRRLQDVADYIERQVYELRHPTEMDEQGYLYEPYATDAEAVQEIFNRMYAAYQLSLAKGETRQEMSFERAIELEQDPADELRFTDEEGYYHSPYERAMAHRLMVGVSFEDGVEQSKTHQRLAFNTIIGKKLQHVRGRLEIDPQTKLVNTAGEDMASATESVYAEDADAPGEVGDGNPDAVVDSAVVGEGGVAATSESGSDADQEAALLTEQSVTMGKEYYLTDRNKLPRESAELQYHIGMTPYMRRRLVAGPDGRVQLSYERDSRPLPKQLAYQVLRQAAELAHQVMAEDVEADVVTYRHWATALQRVVEASGSERADVAHSLLLRFFDHAQNVNQPASRRFSQVADPREIAPSLYEQAFAQRTGRPELRGHAHGAEAGRIVSQLYGFYNSLQRRNIVDTDLSGDTSLANEVADGLEQLKNMAHSSMLSNTYSFSAGSMSWTPRPSTVKNLVARGFRFTTDPATPGGLLLTRYRETTGQYAPVFAFGAPRAGKGGFGFANNAAGVASTYEADPQFYGEAVADLLGELGFKAYANRRSVLALVSERNAEGKAVGVPVRGSTFNEQAGKYAALLLQPLLLEHVLQRDRSSRGLGEKKLAELGLAKASAVEGWFKSSVFTQQPQDDLNVAAGKGGRVVDRHYSATKSYSEVTQPLMNLLTASTVRPERLNAYNADGNRVSLLQHANSLYHQLKSLATAQRRAQRGQEYAGRFVSRPDNYRNPVVTGDLLHVADDVLNLGVLADQRTGRKHQLTKGSAREFTRAFFEKFFLQELAGSNGQSVVILGSPKSDKDTQMGHRLRQNPDKARRDGLTQPLAMLEGSVEARAALLNVHRSYQALLRHDVLPRLQKASEKIAAQGGVRLELPAGAPLEAQLQFAETWLKAQTPGVLAKSQLVKGVDYNVSGSQVTGIGTMLRERVMMPSEQFTAEMEQSLAFEASELHAQGFTYFDKKLADRMMEATGLQVDLKAFASEGGRGYRVRTQNPATGAYEFNPLVKAFLLSQTVHRHNLENALIGSDVYFKPGKGVPGGDGVDYAKRLIALTTNYEAYDLNAYGGLPPVSRVALLKTETLGGILAEGDYAPEVDAESGAVRRGQHLGQRYTYTDENGRPAPHAVQTSDQGQFFEILRAMAPGETEEARSAWAREKIEGQDLFDGLQFSTMLHDFQHLRSGLQPQWDESQRKTIYGGLMPDGLPALNKTSTTRITNELLENGNQQLWAQLYGMLGGFQTQPDGSLRPSPLIEEWWRIRQELAQEYGGEDSPLWRRREVRGNESWKRLAELVRRRPDLEQHHIGLTNFGLKVGNVGTANVLDTDYSQSVRLMDNRRGGTVLSLNQNLRETDIANITQENYIFSLQGLNWQTTEQINGSLAELAKAGLLDMQELVRTLGGPELFKRRAQEMLDNMGNVSNTNAMLGARLDANLPLLATVMGTAIASQVKAKMSKLRFAGARFTVSSSSGRVNMYEVAGVGAMTSRQLLREGYATRNLLGELVPTGKGSFAVRELAFTRYAQRNPDGTAGALLSADDAYYFATLVKAGSEGDSEAANEAHELAKKYVMLPMEVMVSRDAFKEFRIPESMDFDQVNEQYFVTRELHRLVREAQKADPNNSEQNLRRFMAEASEARPQGTAEELAAWDGQQAAAYTPDEVKGYREQIYNQAVQEAETGELQGAAQEAGADLWQNFQRRAEMKVTRIPVTGLNSIQVGRVVGFYDSQANTMLLPAQVQTVAGADNDGDMVTAEYHDTDRQGRSHQEGTRDGQAGQTRNFLRETKMAAMRDPLNVLQAFHPIDFASLNTYKKQAIELEQRLSQADAGQGGVTPGYGPLGYLYRFSPSVATLIKNQQGKSGVGPFVKLSQLYYQNVALLKSLQAQQRLGAGGRVLGDLQQPLTYGEYTINSTAEREVATANLLENVANGSLDNAKEDLLGWLNVNPQMWGAYSAMMFAQVPENEIFRLLSHPYAKQVAAAAQRSRDVDQGFALSVADVCEKILLGDSYGVRTEGELMGFGGFGYTAFGQATAEARQQTLNEKLQQRKGKQQAASVAAGEQLAQAQARLEAAEQALMAQPELKRAQQEAAVARRLVEKAAKKDTSLRDRLANTADFADKKQSVVQVLAGQQLDEQNLKTQNLRRLIELDGVQEVPDLENIVNRNPKAGMSDYMARKFVIEQLYLFSLRGDELLQAQGVLRALEGPPGNEFDALRTLERVLTGLGYSGSDIDGSLEAIKQELLADDSWPLLDAQGQPRFDAQGQPLRAPALSMGERWALAAKTGGELVNMRAHLLGNPALEQAVRGLIFDYEQRRGQFITRQPVVQSQLKELMGTNRAYYMGKGAGTLMREFRAWLDARFFAQQPALRLDPTITGDGLPYLQQLAAAELTSLAGQQQFLDTAANYLYSLKNRTRQAGGRPDIGAIGLIQELVPRDNEFGQVVTLNNSENLDPEQKAVLQSEFEELGNRFGAEGKAVQQVLFTYALLTRGLQAGKGSLAELVSPDAARAYSDFLLAQRGWFGAKANTEQALADLQDFKRQFQLLNPQSAPELRKPDGVDEAQEAVPRSYFNDREIELAHPANAREEGESRDRLPLLINRGQVLAGNRRYRTREAALMPPVLSIANRNAAGGFAVYEKVLLPATEEMPKGDYRYERRFTAATPQTNAYNLNEAIATLPVVPVNEEESRLPVSELLANPASELRKSIGRLEVLAGQNPDLLQELRAGRPVMLSTGESASLRKILECDVV